MNLITTENKELTEKEYQKFLRKNILTNIIIPNVKEFIDSNKFQKFIMKYNKKSTDFYELLFDEIMDVIDSENVYFSVIIDTLHSFLYDKLANINEKVDEMVEDYVEETFTSNAFNALFKFSYYDVIIDYELTDSYYSENGLCESPIIKIIIADNMLDEFLNNIKNNKCEIKLNDIFYLHLWSLSCNNKFYDVRKKILLSYKKFEITSLDKNKIYQIKEQNDPNATWIQLTEEQYKLLRFKEKEQNELLQTTV